MKRIKAAAVLLVMTFILSSCTGGISDDTVASVGEETVSAGEIAFLIAQNVEAVKKQMEGMEDSEKQEYWNTDVDGKKPADIIKENAMEYLLNYAAFAQASKDEGISVSSSEVKTKMNTAFSQEDLKKYKDTYGVSSDAVRKVVRKQLLYQKYLTRILEKKKDYNPTEEQLAELFKSDYFKAKHILFKITDSETGAEYSPEQVAEIREKAENVLSRAKRGEDFDKLMNEFSEDPGLSSNPDGYVFTDGEMITEFQDAVKNLPENGISELVKSSYGFHIIKRLPLDDADMAAKQSDLTVKFKSKYTDTYAESLKSKYDVKQDDTKLNEITVNTGI